MVVEGEVLNDFPRFIGVLIAEFAGGGVVNLVLKMKGDMIINKLDLKPTIDAVMRDFWRFYGPFRWKELSKKIRCKILPCGEDPAGDVMQLAKFKALSSACNVKNLRAARDLRDMFNSVSTAVRSGTYGDSFFTGTTGMMTVVSLYGPSRMHFLKETPFGLLFVIK
ncbi:hypothetical protein Tco_1386451 [Tanacetum coccineum]